MHRVGPSAIHFVILETTVYSVLFFTFSFFGVTLKIDSHSHCQREVFEAVRLKTDATVDLANRSRRFLWSDYYTVKQLISCRCEHGRYSEQPALHPQVSADFESWSKAQSSKTKASRFWMKMLKVGKLYPKSQNIKAETLYLFVFCHFLQIIYFGKFCLCVSSFIEIRFLTKWKYFLIDHDVCWWKN